MTNFETISIDRLNEVLYRVTEALIGSQIQSLIVGSTARDIFDGKPITGQRLDIGIPSSNITPNTLGIFKVMCPQLELRAEGGFMGRYDGVPVYQTTLNPNVDVFEFPDHVFYMADQYLIPNPFERYWYMFSHGYIK